MDKISFSELYSNVGRAETPKQKFRREVAELTGKKEQTVKQWLSGTQFPTPETVQKIADFFGVDPDGLFPERDNNKET